MLDGLLGQFCLGTLTMTVLPLLRYSVQVLTLIQRRLVLAESAAFELMAMSRHHGTPIFRALQLISPSGGSAVMIWYLLYPFRGTTEPPILSTTHPIRKTFAQYGRRAARHPVITLLISVALSAVLIYPFPFLYTNNFKNGTANLPHHVWTAAQPFEGPATTLPDVVMRSFWMHGDYMKALDPKVLQAALRIQDSLLGSTLEFNPASSSDIGDLAGLTDEKKMQMFLRDHLHASNGMSNHSWFFHSPLLYWFSSQEAISNDKDIIETVNHGASRTTRANTTLRHSIVFSGKRFEDKRLVAADALVITLVHKPDSPVGREWERQVAALGTRSSGEWQLFPGDGRVKSSKLYEFKFQPLSVQDDLLLALAYGLTTLYFFIRLTKLRAIKSHIGLTITIASQLAVSIMSSFTVCAIFKIDLSKVPREAYPFVVLTIGLENMFRLINAVLVTPSEIPPASRIAEALGATGHVTLAKVCENLFVLWMFYHVVAPGMQAFCIFAAMALVFDFLYLMTFFLAVLSVDIRRTELSDSLRRIGRHKYKKSSATVKTTWGDAILRGDIPVSTRVAGSIVMVVFILTAQWHFFDQEHPLRTFHKISRLFKPNAESQPTSFAGINQARTPTAWLRLQDHETAREVIQVVKPNAHSYIAQVYEPLIVVLNGSDRTSTNEGVRPFLPAAYDFLRHQSLPFVATVLFVVAAVSLLMNYLLWDEEQQGRNDDEAHHMGDESCLAVGSLEEGHTLDVVMLATSPKGCIASIGLDRQIRVWKVQHREQQHLVGKDGAPADMFPIVSTAVDDSGCWLAIASMSGRVSLWDIESRDWGSSLQLADKLQTPLLFSFKTGKTLIPDLVIIHQNSLMNQIEFQQGTPRISELQICKSPLVLVRQFWSNNIVASAAPLLSMITVSRRGCVHVVTQQKDQWFSEGIEDIWPKRNEGVLSVVPLPLIRCFLAVREDEVDLISLQDYTRLHTFRVENMVPTSVRCFHPNPKHQTHVSVLLDSFTLIYNDQSTGNCIVSTYTPRKQTNHICISDLAESNEASVCHWIHASNETREIANPGQWEVLPVGVVVGMRKHGSTLSKSFTPHDSILRQRTPLSKLQIYPNGDADTWEAWTFSLHSDTLEVKISDNTSVNHALMATSCGPLMRIGQRSIAVGLGNVVKIITIGHERFDGAGEMTDDLTAAIGRRRRPLSGKRGCGNGARSSDDLVR